MDVIGELKSGSLILLCMGKENYRNSIKELYPGLSGNFSKIGYITINRPFNAVLDTIKSGGADESKFYFVDAITATVKSPPIIENCIFVSSPSALTDLGLAFSALMSEKGCDIVFFDAISTLLIYQDIGSVIKFVHNLITKASVMNKKAVFLALKEDSEILIKDLNMFVDKVVEA